MIERRLKFALDMAEGKLQVQKLDFSLHAQNLALFLKALIISLKRNKDIHEFLGNITAGNIRSVLDLVTRFIGSPNVDAEKIIDIMERQNEYLIPLHEFTKSALLGDYSHYNPETSIAMNVYDICMPDPKAHFLVPIILSYMGEDLAKLDKDGFIFTKDIIEELQTFSYNCNQIENALRRLTNKKLIETSQRVTFEEDESGLIGELPLSFRLTTVGAYHLKRWITTFTYLDAMVFDTPIFDSQLSSNLVSNINSFDIKERLHRTIEFRKYLIDIWLTVPNKPAYFNFEQMLRDNDDSFNGIKRAIERNITNKVSS